MNALEATLLRAYLDGELDADAAQEFEILILERPDLAERVEADTALRMGMAELASAGAGLSDRIAADPGEFPVETPGKGGLAAHTVHHRTVHAARDRHVPARIVDSTPRLRNPVVPMAAAALVLLGVGFGLGTLDRNADVSTQFGKAVQIEKTRGIGANQTISLPGSGYLIAYLDAGSTRPCESDPRIRLSQGQRSLFDSTARPDDLGFVWLVLPRLELKAGKAKVEMSCGETILADYPLDLIE